jgi:glycosyltransferase involved in cell wall biosynthesis
MRIVMVSKALVVGMYQRKLEELAALPDIDLTVAVPPFWRERGTRLWLERTFTQGYDLRVLPMHLNGHYHLHFYPGLGRLLEEVEPDLLHFDEEAYNVSTWLALRDASRRGIPLAFYTWQNLYQRYPPPFRWLEADVLRRASLAMAGSGAAAEVLRRKGYRGPVDIIPQFGIDPALFTPAAATPGVASRPFTIGFVGRLIPEKGLSVLLEALAPIEGDWQLLVIGSGPEREPSQALAARLGCAARVHFKGQIPSTQMPAAMQSMDVLVGPSLTGKSWKEQFGRMFVEAMACEVPVVGSDSGEIPRVVGDGGIIVPEGNVLALRQAIDRLRRDAHERERLGKCGRQHVLAHYTQAAVALATAQAYRRVLASGAGSAPASPVG